jgi:hypothetical protein
MKIFKNLYKYHTRASMDVLIEKEVKDIVESFFNEAYPEDENDIEEKYDNWASDIRHQEVDDHITRMDERDVYHLLCRFGISKAFQLFMDEQGIDKKAPTELALLYGILYNRVCELTSHTDYVKWNRRRRAREVLHDQQGQPKGIRASGEECPICYEGYGEKPNGDFLCKDGKANSPYAEECKHYICVKCCEELSKAEHVKCPLCREDWTEWIHEFHGEEAEGGEEVSDDDEEDE